LKPGQFITGRSQANADLGLKSIMFDRKVKVLQNINFLNRQVNNRFSIITIRNWEEYQSRQEKMNSRMNNKRTTDEQQMNTNKKTYKNDKNKTTTPDVDVAVKIFQIFKGSMEQTKIQNLIKGKDPDEMLRLANYCSEKGENPPGLFIIMVKEGTKPPMPATKTVRRNIPPPAGGYQTGEGPLLIDEDREAEKAESEEKKEKVEEESDEEFQRRMEKDVERIKKESRSSNLSDPLHKQLERLKLRTSANGKEKK